MSSAPALPSPSSASVPMVLITVVGILAAFALLASYYAFVTRCQLLRAAPWRSGQGGHPSSAAAAAAVDEEQPRRGLGLPLIRMIPVVKFTAGDEQEGRRASVSSECAVCLSEFVERERVRLLPGCSHAFHIDCIDTWLQGSARCPFCRRSITLPPQPLLPPRQVHHGDDQRVRRDERLYGSDSIVIEVRGERESWGNGGGGGGGGGRKVRKKAVGDEAVETRKKEEFAVEPVRRSLSMDSSCDKHKLYVSVVKEFLAQRQQVS